MGWGVGNLLWIHFRNGCRILDIYLYKENIVPFTKQLHIGAHAVKFSQSGVQSCYASIPHSGNRLVSDRVLETAIQNKITIFQTKITELIISA